MFPGDMHGLKSGIIAVAHNEAARRSLAGKLAAKYQRENKVFGTAAVTIMHQHIESKHVIAAAGPIYSTSNSDQKGCFKLGVGAIIENLGCNVTNTDRDEALRALREVCQVRTAFAKTRQGSWET
jgi:uncharacterized protein YgfB (UPF0149 family)